MVPEVPKIKGDDMAQTEQENLPLLPERHPSKDFFIADIFNSLPFKDDMASMEHPLFTLSKKRDFRDLYYENGNVSISIKPTSDGLPTIFDKDVLLYCGSLLMEQINKGSIPPRTLRVSSHDLLVATNRPTNGKGYELLKKALDRLKGVSIKTNIKTNKRETTKAFGLIESYEIIVFCTRKLTPCGNPKLTPLGHWLAIGLCPILKHADHDKKTRNYYWLLPTREEQKTTGTRT